MSKVDIQERGNMPVSDNCMIHEGMKRSDATDISKMSVFNFADVNKDGVISRAEVERYNAPIFMKNYDTGKEVMFGANKTTPFQADGYSQFYSGLDIRSVEQRAVDDFKIIDIDNDGIISKTEMQAMEKAFIETQNTKESIKAIGKKTDIIKWISGIACAPIPVALFLWFGNEFESIAHASFGKYMATSGAIVLGLGLLGIGVALVCKKLADSRIKKLAESTDNHPYALSKTESIKETYQTSKAY